MKAIFINGSPRKKFNTAQLLESAMKGSPDAGAETEWIMNSPAVEAALPVRSRTARRTAFAPCVTATHSGKSEGR